MRLQEVAVQTEAPVPLVPVAGHVLQKGEALAVDEAPLIGLLHLAEQPSIAGDEAGVEQGDPEEEIIPCVSQAGVDGADAVTDLETGVPQGVKNRLGYRGQLILDLLAMQEQQVDVGEGKEFTPAIATDRNQGHAARGLGAVAENVAEVAVDKLGVLPQQGSPLQPLPPQNL